MNIQDLLEPESLFKHQLKDQHHDNVVNFFNELVEKSGVNKDENIANCDKIYAKQQQSKVVESKISKSKIVKTLAILSIIFGSITLVACVLLFVNSSALPGVIALLVGLSMLTGGILLLALVVKPRVKRYNEILTKLRKEIDELTALAWSQMSPLNALFDDMMPAQLFHKSVPLIEMDRIFDTKKLEFLIEKYDFHSRSKDNISTLNIQSGSILGNPFVVFKDLEMNMVPHRYEGTLVITYRVRHYGKNGSYYVTHTQTLRAYVTKPRPQYSEDTYLLYGNEAAPNLTFSRGPSSINQYDEKGLEKYVRKHESDLYKMAEKEMKKGGQYTPLGNAEFELFFGGLNRDNEVEYRLLFTPLAQKSMLSLLKSNTGYGDDFSFYKVKKLNRIISIHSQGDTLFINHHSFYDFDFRKIEQKFIELNDDYFKALYFDFAPLMSIPLYQQHKAHEYIYKGTIPSNFTNYEHEVISNKYNQKEFVDPLTTTRAILKTTFANKTGEQDNVMVTAHSFQAIKRIEYVPTLGGDGCMHNVPVTWYEYIPLEKTTPIVVGDTGTSYPEFRQTGNNDVIFSRGLVSYNQDRNLNTSIEDLKSKMIKN